MTTSAFMVDKRELEFIMFEFLQVEDLLKYPYFSDHTKDSISAMLNSAIDACHKVIGPLNKVYDTVGCTHDKTTKVVHTPQGTKEAYTQFVENGFMTTTEPYEANGLQAPAVLGAVFQEIFTGANQAFTMFSGLTKSGAHLLWEFGNDWMRDMTAQKIARGQWTATMCLTEPSVGTAVGDLHTTAKRMADGTFRLKGVKQWISGGENDFAENIIHLVMARIEGAPEGIEGVSLFLVPKKRFDTKTFEIKEPNDVFCISIEEKLGIHGNPTCLMSFGDKDNCEAYLIGEENHGITSMFLMMNMARIGVGLQGVGQAAVAFLNAERYAKERIQGVDFTAKREQNQKRVPIVDHPDIKRMLLRQRAIVEGARTLCYLVTQMHDYSMHDSNSQEQKKYNDFVALLTPITKAWSTDMGFESIVLSMQTYGGYGFVKDYPIEQYMRDAKITSIYEGTNGIQALDFVGRKMRMEDGEVFMSWLERHTNFIEAHRTNPFIGTECELLEECIGLLLEGAMIMGERGKSGDRKGAIVNAYPYMMAFGHTTICGLLLEQANICETKLKSANLNSEDKRFYQNKIRTAKFFAHNILPEAKSFLSRVLSDDRSCLEFEFH